MSESNVSTPQPLSKNARRVLGVLVEKAKTTPDNYPLSLAALVSGCNQKSNRSPQMDLDDDDVLLALDELRTAGAAREIQGSGRVAKYRHAAYEWMSIDAAEAAIMTELLLRGAQTVGELRGRASRMHPFEELSAVQSVLELLESKGLAEAITPAGRGQVFAHKLYPPDERQYLLAKLDKEADVSETKAPTPKPAAPDDSVIERILARLDSLNSRIDDIEDRLNKLES